MLVVREDPAGKSVPLLALRVGPDEREALLSIGHYPFFASRTGHDRFVVVLTDDTDWEELRELVTESYRILAPKSSPHCSTSTRWPPGPQQLWACVRHRTPSSRRGRC